MKRSFTVPCSWARPLCPVSPDTVDGTWRTLAVSGGPHHWPTGSSSIPTVADDEPGSWLSSWSTRCGTWGPRPGTPLAVYSLAWATGRVTGAGGRTARIVSMDQQKWKPNPDQSTLVHSIADLKRLKYSRITLSILICLLSNVCVNVYFSDQSCCAWILCVMVSQTPGSFPTSFIWFTSLCVDEQKTNKTVE